MKKKNYRRAQISMEYMVTYGWMIIIIMIVSVALWQMGVFKAPGPTRGCKGFSQIKPMDWKMSGTTLTLTLTNEAGNKLKINSNKVTASVNGISCGTGPATAVDPFRPGQTTQVTLTCSSFSGTVGEYYKASINITYENPASEITHNSVGECWGAIE